MHPHSLVAGKVTHRIDWTENEFSLTIQAPVAPYIAGQFTKLGLCNQQGEWVRRAYSIVNPPSRPHPSTAQVEFLIITVPDGELSNKLYGLNIGDTVYVGEKPSGFMTAEEIRPDAQELWLIATGTGIGPYLAMLEDHLMPYQNIVLVHAVRKQKELVYRDHIHQLQERYAGRLHYIPIVSREKVDGALSGRIPALIESGVLETTAGLTIEGDKSFIYLCGNPDMIRDTNRVLKNRGLRKHLRRKPGHFSYENYW
ncbi:MULTISPECIES: ferredoxin--NADP reductase [Vibrio]|uniref:ferredoxin--NADP(+) reductase n=2 Tax=Vibrio TaxID=662 RepID=A0A7X4LNU7_9VIBR|nr:MULTISPECIES: ferredoxin--NADP reductase [Vibrio]MBF8999724.1 ferredoxin--NADP reductase [Vibrio nitrifigilis]MZI94921.1 ferredoxin--NADP reductase [Vibrio eleionomae]